jgi:hypothetical protein
MRAIRVIFLACLICALAGSAFAKNDKDNGGKGKDGGTYAAPELNLNHPLEYGLLAIAGGSVVLLERRRRRRRTVDR